MWTTPVYFGRIWQEFSKWLPQKSSSVARRIGKNAGKTSYGHDMAITVVTDTKVTQNSNRCSPYLFSILRSY